MESPTENTEGDPPSNTRDNEQANDEQPASIDNEACSDVRANPREASPAGESQSTPLETALEAAQEIRPASFDQTAGIDNAEAPVVATNDLAPAEDPDPPQPLQPYDWDGLQQRFAVAMQEKEEEERYIQHELARLMEFHGAWAQAPVLHEQTRATKRLRTRIAYVHNQELQLEQKRQIHEEVVQAFRNALELLNTLGT